MANQKVESNDLKKSNNCDIMFPLNDQISFGGNMKKIIVLLCLISMLMLVGCSNDSDDLYTEIDQLKNQIATLNEENTNLKNDINELENIDSV